MAEPAAGSIHSPPRWLVLLGSAAIVVHLLLVGIHALAATSGPWPLPDGSTAPFLLPPQFALTVDNEVGSRYLRALHLTHNFHFESNRSARFHAYFEAKLKDADGNELRTLCFPDPAAICYARHRQEALALGLAADQPVPPQGSEVIAPPGQLPPEMQIWDPVENQPQRLQLRSVPIHTLRDRPGIVVMPAPRALALVRSYGRYLCRAHGASSVEISRHSRQPIPPIVLMGQTLPPEALAEVISNFGDRP